MFYAGVTIQNQSLDQTIVDVSCIVTDEIAQVGRQYATVIILTWRYLYITGCVLAPAPC